MELKGSEKVSVLIDKVLFSFSLLQDAGAQQITNISLDVMFLYVTVNLFWTSLSFSLNVMEKCVLDVMGICLWA